MAATKKEKSGSAKPKTAAAPLHASYRDMVKDAIIKLKERNGSSRSKLKQYVLANNKGLEAGPAFDNQLNKAIKTGVEKGDFAQPKGASGTVKLAKKEPKAAKSTTAKKPAAKKTKTEGATKTKAPKKAASGEKKKAAPKKTATKAAKPAAKPKSAANTGAKRKSKTGTSAPAVVDEKKVLGKTKSGRVTKTKAPKAAAKAGAKKAAPKKKTTATPKKEKTPKKSATPAAAA